jgi:CheY-like chemotaxis protein
MCHVLIIEDEPMIAMLLQDVLEEAGANSFAFAATEQDAVDLARQHPPAVITSDVQLLEGTGPQAVEKIHRELGHIPVIFITASPERCTQQPMPGKVLVKPVNIRQVTEAFRQIAA